MKRKEVRNKGVCCTTASSALCWKKHDWLWSKLGGPTSHSFPAELLCTPSSVLLQLFFCLVLQMPRGWRGTDWLHWVPVARAARRARPSPTPVFISIWVYPLLTHWVSSLSHCSCLISDSSQPWSLSGTVVVKIISWIIHIMCWNHTFLFIFITNHLSNMLWGSFLVIEFTFQDFIYRIPNLQGMNKKIPIYLDVFNRKAAVR